jgi:hypothetical protein
VFLLAKLLPVLLPTLRLIQALGTEQPISSSD